MAAEAHRERELARRKSCRPRSGWAWRRTIASGLVVGDLLDLDAALGRAHQQDPRSARSRTADEVELLDDVRGRPDEDLAHVMPLMSMPRICAATRSASSGDPASFTPPALPRPPTRTWALMTTLPARRRRGTSAARACLGHGVGDRPGGDRQALGDEQRLGVGFLEFHARQAPW